MIITNIEIQKNNKEKVNIFIDREYSFSLSLSGLTKFNLYNGKSITTQDIDYYKIEDEKNLAFLFVLNRLSCKMYTEKEITDKLKQKGFNEDSINYAINKAKEHFYIDDVAYSKSFIEEKAIVNKWGINLIFTKLMQKGVNKDIINDCLNIYFEDDFLKQNCYQLAIKKMNLLKMDDLSDKKSKEKLYRFLLSKGYSYDEINSCLEEVNNPHL